MEARAHEVRPAYLELKPSGRNAWDVQWKVPALAQSMRLGISPRLPDGCRDIEQRATAFVTDAYVERWRVACPDGLSGGSIVILGLAALRTDVLLRIEGADGHPDITARILPSEPRFLIPAVASTLSVVATYFRLGVHHILIGADHLLFVLSLLLLVRGWRRLVATVTAFTAGHTLTLAAASLGAIDLPGPPVEAAIALSIACAAAEAVNARRQEPSLLARAPWIMALGFGLLHGFGFAGALREIGLPEHAILTALLFFNIGVEAGQLLFVAAMLGVAATFRWLTVSTRNPVAAAGALGRMEIALCYGIGIAGAFWFAERASAIVFS